MRLKIVGGELTGEIEGNRLKVTSGELIIIPIEDRVEKARKHLQEIVKKSRVTEQSIDTLNPKAKLPI